MHTQSLIVPFLTDDPAFAHGVEFGMLYQRMQHGDDDAIEDCYLIDNQDRILVMAGRIGWRVQKMKKWGDGWFWCRLERCPAPHRGGAGA